jgi:hypothetical protein
MKDKDLKKRVYNSISFKPHNFNNLKNELGISSRKLNPILKELQEEFKIFRRVVGDHENPEIFYYSIRNPLDDIWARSQKYYTDIKDTVVKHVLSEEFAEEEKRKIVKKLSPNTISSYFVYNTLKRNKYSKSRRSGWKIYYNPWKGVKGKQIINFNEREIELEISVTNFKNFDKIAVGGTFRRDFYRKKKIPALKQKAYINKTFADIIHGNIERTETGDRFSYWEIWVSGGDRKKAREIHLEYLRKLECQLAGGETSAGKYSITDRMLIEHKDLISKKNKVDEEKANEFALFVGKKSAEKLEILESFNPV